jgi:hypothetical protein
MAMKILKWVGLAVFVAFVAMQVVRPTRANPKVDPTKTMQAVLVVPPAIDAIFARACNDCHSSLTRWPWYSEVAPASWLVAQDVRQGRKELSFSEFGAYSPKKQAHKLDEICEMVESGDMPIASYALLHADAKLTLVDKTRVCEWAKAESARIAAMAAAAAMPAVPPVAAPEVTPLPAATPPPLPTP